jgi:hypothetical protein
VADVHRAEELRVLADLRDRGVLTESEYLAETERVLRRPDPSLAPSAGPTEEPRRRRPRMAERSNFTAILALLCAVTFWPAGMVLGYKARREARGQMDGDARLALIALVVAYVAAAITVAVIVTNAVN